MDEYVARNTAKRWLAFAVGTGVSAVETIDQVPAADVAPVVRCKDCKYYNRGECYHPRHERHLQSICQEDDDFCSYGERKDGGEHVK